MLNMLIAIMGDTFDNMIENREVNATKTKLKLITECIVKKHAFERGEVAEKEFMIIVKPDDGQDDEIEDKWEGSTRRIELITTKCVD